MKVLITDDCPEKINWIINKLIETDSVNINDIVVRNTGSEGLRELNNNNYDLLILDMQMPWRKGERTNTKCGLMVLNELKRVEKDIDTIVCSSSGSTPLNEYNNVKGFVYYDISTECNKFKDIINKIKK